MILAAQPLTIYSICGAMYKAMVKLMTAQNDTNKFKLSLYAYQKFKRIISTRT